MTRNAESDRALRLSSRKPDNSQSDEPCTECQQLSKSISCGFSFVNLANCAPPGYLPRLLRRRPASPEQLGHQLLGLAIALLGAGRDGRK